jgi:hypothetical protein
MIHADQILDDEMIVAAMYEALNKRHPNSRSRIFISNPDLPLRPAARAATTARPYYGGDVAG